MSASGTRDPRIRLVMPDDAEAIAEVATLFAEYAAWLASFVTHTTIAEELASLPAPFAPPDGALLVGVDADGTICGCVGVKRHDEVTAEIKRLYVREACRGTGLGAALFSAALEVAGELGYSAVVISTIPSHMAQANAMYERLGFTPTGRFERHTHADVEMRYLRLDLGKRCR